MLWQLMSVQRTGVNMWIKLPEKGPVNIENMEINEQNPKIDGDKRQELESDNDHEMEPIKN